MGLIIGRLRRKKTTEEILEQLETEIRAIEEYRRSTEEYHKRVVGGFVVISVGIYLLGAFLLYFYFFPTTFYDRLFYIIPLILAPVVILAVQRLLTWYYKWKISRKQNKLITLRNEKRKMLEKVMDTETYKVAKNILEKFAEPSIRKSTALLASMGGTPQKPPVGTPLPSNTVVTGGGLRQRALPPPNQQMIQPTPARPMIQAGSLSTIGRTSPVIRPDYARSQQLISLPPSVVAQMGGTPLPMPRVILSRNRSVFDKMVDYLVGDGPSNRYALICKNCSSHNGMAFREEFEYISFRCCYCFTFNPARKKRPVAPKLNFSLKSPHIHGLPSDTSESEKNSPSDTDSESETPPSHKSHIRKLAVMLEEKAGAEATGDSEQEQAMPMDVDSSIEEPQETIELVPATIEEGVEEEENVGVAADIVKD